MEHPRVIPGQDGAGVIDQVGPGVPPARLGERVWVYEAYIGRPFGTAAEYVVVPSANANRWPSGAIRTSLNFLRNWCGREGTRHVERRRARRWPAASLPR